jgi:hypothetical protein
MKYNLNQRSASPTCEVRRNRMLTSTFLMVVVLVGIIAASASANAQTTLSVKPGWDVFDPGSGQVIYKLTTIRCRSRLNITYILKGATPLKHYHVFIGLFNLPGDGVKFFGVPRFSRSTHTREDVKATHDAFLLGEFFTDRFGNGRRSFDLDLSDVPAGLYDAQFTWGQLSDLRGHYRTGSKYGAGFAKIVVP